MKKLSGVIIEARKKEDKNYVAFSFTKEINGVKYKLPNYLYYDSLKIMNSKLFDIEKFAEVNGCKDSTKVFEFAKKYSNDMFHIYQQINLYKIFSSPTLGDFVVFFIDANRFWAYIPNKQKVFNEFWRNKFDEAKEVEKDWLYSMY
ncbi:hypothetical protein [Niabella terrae]